MQIVTHPANSHLIEGLVQKTYGPNIHFPLGIPIIYNDMMPEDEHIRWELSNPNSWKAFFLKRWIDLANPPRWTIRYKIVKEVRAPLFYGFQAQSMCLDGESYRFCNIRDVGYTKHGPR